MDFSPTSAGLFRDLGGLACMIQRLQAKVGLAGSKLDAATAAAIKGKQPAGEEPTEYAVAYSRRLLLKSLLRAIALASYAPGSAARPQVNALLRPLVHLRWLALHVWCSLAHIRAAERKHGCAAMRWLTTSGISS